MSLIFWIFPTLSPSASSHKGNELTSQVYSVWRSFGLDIPRNQERKKRAHTKILTQCIMISQTRPIRRVGAKGAWFWPTNLRSKILDNDETAYADSRKVKKKTGKQPRKNPHAKYSIRKEDKSEFEWNTRKKLRPDNRKMEDSTNANLLFLIPYFPSYCLFVSSSSGVTGVTGVTGVKTLKQLSGVLQQFPFPNWLRLRSPWNKWTFKPYSTCLRDCNLPRKEMRCCVPYADFGHFTVVCFSHAPCASFLTAAILA